MLVATPEEGGTELRRKVRGDEHGGCVRRWRSATGCCPRARACTRSRSSSTSCCARFVGFFLVALLASSVALAAADPTWWLLLGPQLGFYALAAAGGLRRTRAGAALKPLWIPYFFCLANGAAALAVLSLLAGVRFERWEPVGMRGGVARG